LSATAVDRSVDEPLAEQDRQILEDEPLELVGCREVLVRGGVVGLDPSDQLRQAILTVGRRSLEVHQARHSGRQQVLVLET
jgi:hypothetical protein